jgi:hypothetical protein
VGPFAIATCVVAAAWLVVAAGLALSGIAPPVLGLAGAAGLIGLGLTVMGIRMIVITSPEGVRVIGQQLLAWPDIEEISVRRVPGLLPLHVPVVSARRGRALIGVELDGLSWVGSNTGARRFAQLLADRAGLGVVEILDLGRSAPARRLDA